VGFGVEHLQNQDVVDTIQSNSNRQKFCHIGRNNKKKLIINIKGVPLKDQEKKGNR